MKEKTRATTSLAIALLLLVIGTSDANAATVTIAWTHPTQNVDGSPLPVAQITRTRVEWGSCNGTAFGTEAGEAFAEQQATTLATPDLAPGVYCFRAFTRRTVNSVHVWSDPSNVATHTIAPPLPSKPRAPVITVSIAVQN